MGSVDNIALVRRVFEEGMNQRKVEVFDELMMPTFQNHDMPAPSPGPEGFRMVLDMFQAAFPDMYVNLEEVLSADGERVVTRGTFTGTHKGEFMGIPASGAPIVVKFIDIWRVENGERSPRIGCASTCSV
jgi:steroid delta-isomerase-like uncharacterized protein